MQLEHVPICQLAPNARRRSSLTCKRMKTMDLAVMRALFECATLHGSRYAADRVFRPASERGLFGLDLPCSCTRNDGISKILLIFLFMKLRQ
jgi:hypothetical protein